MSNEEISEKIEEKPKHRFERVDSETFTTAINIIKDVTPKLDMDTISREIKLFTRHLINAIFWQEASIPLEMHDSRLVWCRNNETNKYDLMVESSVNGLRPVIQCKVHIKIQAHSRLPALAKVIRETIIKQRETEDIEQFNK